MRELKKLLRPNVLNMTTYSSARDEYKGNATIFMDANENPFDWKYNRYPDTNHTILRACISTQRKIDPKFIAIGNGSDEIIDLLMRAFCEPAKDSIRIIEPSYGMYAVSAQLNNIAIEQETLTPQFQLANDSMLLGHDPKSAIENTEKMLFLCSPNNPTGNCFPTRILEKIIQNYPGIVVLDEAYIDFSDQSSMRNSVTKYSNLVVIQTMSKAFAAAGLRIGIAFANEKIIDVLRKIKPPYNVSQIAMNEAVNQWNNIMKIEQEIQEIKENRKILSEKLIAFDYVLRVFPSQANFILCRVKNAENLYKYLVQHGIVVRLRNQLTHCENCLRFSIGTSQEIAYLLTILQKYTDE